VSEVNIDRALQIEGWMTAPELRYLALAAQNAHAIIEVGSFLGRSTRALADHTPGMILAIDDWYGPRDAEITDENRTRIEDLFKKNLDDSACVRRNDLITWKIDHEKIDRDIVFEQFENLQADFIFIDGDHSYEAVKRDIQLWRQYLVKGGVLAGHDYAPEFPGVRQAVQELLPEMSVVPNTSIWTWKKV
jgi:hypothetical protein